jgi:hypothetical protein
LEIDFCYAFEHNNSLNFLNGRLKDRFQNNCQGSLDDVKKEHDFQVSRKWAIFFIDLNLVLELLAE